MFLVSMVTDQNKQTVETSTVHPQPLCVSMESTLWTLVVVFYLFWFFFLKSLLGWFSLNFKFPLPHSSISVVSFVKFYLRVRKDSVSIQPTKE